MLKKVQNLILTAIWECTFYFDENIKASQVSLERHVSDQIRIVLLLPPRHQTSIMFWHH